MMVNMQRVLSILYKMKNNVYVEDMFVLPSVTYIQLLNDRTLFLIRYGKCSLNAGG
jgi:hypothetical protein